MGDPDSARALRPLRRLTLPGGRTLLRAGLVAILLGLAAAILHTPTSCPPTAEPSRAPTGADGTAGRSDEGGPTDPGGAGSTGDSDTAGPPPTGAAAGDSSTTGSGTAGDGSTGRDGTTTGSGRTSPLPLPSGAVGVPVRLAEPAALAVARPGTRVDLLAATPGGAGTEATLLAPAVLVLDVLGADATDGSSALYLALRPDQAKRAVGLPEGTRFAIVVRG
ncbi:flagellar biosynthesis protein FlgA [Micromonospora sp. C81]|uniref:flagellar biosynthesis protein FlgA n=1 Tax=Micromonospora sp. C81 TaxID=2824881 RepID=UPI001FFC7AD7|nr:flagellar biosynthesis protein FlgA [Micromonospora sp. C81]